MSVYLEPPVYDQLRDLAYAERTKMHALMLEGLDLLFKQRGAQSIARRALNMFTLIAIGTGTAYLYSVAALLVPDLFPAALRDGHGTVPVYFEAASVVIVLVLLGQVLELRARETTSDAIKSLLRLAPRGPRAPARTPRQRRGAATSRCRPATPRTSVIHAPG